MSGNTTLLVVVLVVGEQLGRRFIHPYFGVFFVPLVLGAQLAYIEFADRGRRRRLAAIKAMPQDQQRAATDALTDDDERAAAKLHLGLLDPLIDGPQAAEEDVFSYPRSWQRSVTWTYWLTLGMAAIIVALGYVQNVVARRDFLPWLGLVLGFTGVAAFIRWSERILLSRVFINVNGVGSIDAKGLRRIIFWGDLLFVRWRPWLGQMEFYGRGRTKKLSASTLLERFPRFTELVLARLKAMTPPDAA